MSAQLPGSAESRWHLVRGVKWLGIGTLTYHAIHLSASILLARVLWPQEFGVFAAALVAIQVGLCVVDPGLSATVIQRVELRDSHTHTIYWSTFSLGLLLAMIAYLASDYFERSIGPTGSGALLAILSPVLAINGACAVPLALLHRRLQFRAIAGLEVLATLLQAIVAATTALSGFGVLSLALGQLIRQCTVLAVSWTASRHRPRLSFSARELTESLPLATPLFGLAFVGTYLNQIDVYLVAKVLGAAPLGFYNRALFMTKFASQQIAALVQRAAFPSFSRVQAETDEIRFMLLQFVSISACLSIPAMAGLYLTAPALVAGLFGPRWVDAVPLVRILCPAGALWTIEALNGPILMARNRLRTWFLAELIAAASLTAVLVVAAGKGIQTFAAAIVCFVAVRSLVSFWLACAQVQATAASLLRRLWAPVGASAFMFAGIAPLQIWVSPQDSPWLFMSIAAPGGVALVTAALAVLSPSQLAAVVKAVRAMATPAYAPCRPVDPAAPRS